MEVLILALLSAVSMLIILCKMFGFHRVVRHQKIVDIVCTVGLPFLFFGSFSGMATAIIAGVIISGVLYAGGKLMSL